MIESVDAVIDAVGGTSAASRLAGVGLSAVSNWKSRGRIPAEKFKIFERALARLGTHADPKLFGFDVETPAEETSA